jgi:hypothetical protein
MRMQLQMAKSIYAMRYGMLVMILIGAFLVLVNIGDTGKSHLFFGGVGLVIAGTAVFLVILRYGCAP